MPNFDHNTLEFFAIVAIAAGIVFQAIILLVLALGVLRGLKKLQLQTDELREKILPAVEQAQRLLTGNKPKIEESVENLLHVSRTLKSQSSEIAAQARVVADRVKHHGTRIDGMVTAALDTVDHTADVLTEAVQKPVRQVSAVLATVKGVVQSFQNPEPKAAAGQTVLTRRDEPHSWHQE